MNSRELRLCLCVSAYPERGYQRARLLCCPLGSAAEIRTAKSRVRFTPRKRTCAVQLAMSAMGQ
jgi:hypothetical protein